jgi:hypothetical protein
MTIVALPLLSPTKSISDNVPTIFSSETGLALRRLSHAYI